MILIKDIILNCIIYYYNFLETFFYKKIQLLDSFETEFNAFSFFNINDNFKKKEKFEQIEYDNLFHNIEII